MDLRRELVFTVGALVLLNVLLALGAIGLLARMGPAIDHIMRENDYSIVASEEVVHALARAHGQPLTEEERARVVEALLRARNNITEPEELPILNAVDERLQSALDGDPDAVAAVLAGLQELIDENRVAMRAADEEAQRLGFAGTWAAVFVGVVSFAASFVLLVRLRRRVVRPLVELHRVLEQVRKGDPLRRCGRPDAPTEVREVLSAVNALLDERAATTQVDTTEASLVERLGLLALLDREERPALVLDADGELRCASQAALDALAGDGGAAIKAEMARLGDGDADGLELITPERLPPSGGWLCWLAERPALS